MIHVNYGYNNFAISHENHKHCKLTLLQGKSAIRTVVWLAVFSALAATTILGIVEVLNEFFEYEVITSSDISHETQIQFPAITVCNINKARDV